jgi:hypothetical protein
MEKSNSNAAARRFFGAALLCLLLLSAGFFGYQRTTQSAPEAAQAAASADALAAIAALRQPPDAARSPHVHSHDMPLALRFQNDDDFKQNQHWFEAGQVLSSGNFLSSMTPLVLDQSCQSHSALQHASLEAAISDQLGFDVSQATPDDILVEDIAQFWTQNGRFFKLGGRWDRRLPAMYEVNHFSAADAAFSVDVQNLPAPMALTGKLDIVSLGEYVDRVLQAIASSGGVRGARLVHARPNADGPAHDLKLNNGKPISWAFGTGRCQRRNSGSAFCKCAVGPALAAIDHSEVPAALSNNAINPEALKDEYHVID